MRTTSPASAATSVPVPTAIPTVALARAGASLMPSPTKQVPGRPCAASRSAFSAGSSPAWTSVMLTRLGDGLRRRRPVAGQHDDALDSGEPQLGHDVGGIRADAVLRPDQAERPRRRGRRAAPSDRPRRAGPGRRPPPAAWGRPDSSRNRRVPTTTGSPATVAVTPPPGWAWKSSAAGTDSRRSAAAVTISRPSGCSLPCSAAAAVRSNSSSSVPNGTTSPSSRRPSVSVPVLSKANVPDAGQPLQGRAAFDQHAGPRQPAQGGDHGGRRGQDRAHTGRRRPGPPASGRRSPAWPARAGAAGPPASAGRSGRRR